MKPVGVLRFPGTNCDFDVWQALEAVDLRPQWIWYLDHFDPNAFSALMLPGGFSYGDYLRCGALAAKASAMQDVAKAARQGVPVLGICNGFQILCESQLLPGVLLPNAGQRYIDRWVNLKLQAPCASFAASSLSEARIPIAHADGRFHAPEDTVKSLWDNDQVWWTYQDNPNGSVSAIAGVMSANKNVAGLMPHPERAIADWMGGDQGKQFFMTLMPK